LNSSGPPPEESSEQSDESEPQPPVEEVEEIPEAPPPEAEEEPSLDRLWDEAYEDLVETEPPPKRKRKRFSHWGGVTALAVILVLLLIWTILSPPVLGPVGETYVRSPKYSDWGNYTGTRDLWAGTTTWGVSLRCISASEGNATLDLGVLVTKISESTGNWFFRGTGITLKNVSAYEENGTFLGAMTNHSDLGYGVQAFLPIEFPASGAYWVFVKVKFLVSEVMRIGFLPLENVQVEKVWVDIQIHVTIP